MSKTQIYANNYKEVWDAPDGEKLAYQLPDDVAIEHFRSAQETINEVIRQNIKFGERRTLPDVDPKLVGTGVYQLMMRRAQEITDDASQDGTLTWADILTEEVYESYAAETDDDREMELIQVAAVAWSWVEDIRRRRASK